MNNQRKISNYWINSKFQSKFLLWVAAPSLGLVSVIFGLSYAFFRTYYNVIIESGPLNADGTSALAGDIQFSLILIAMTCLIFVGFMILLSIIASHKTAGPMYKLEREFIMVASGEKKLGKLSFRDYDDFQEIAQAYNNLIDKIQEPKTKNV